jgi:hypothetical protein
MRVILLVLVLVGCTDPTKVAPEPTIGAISGTIVAQSNSEPVAGVHVTIRSLTDTTYAAQATTDSLGSFFQNDVPTGQGQFQLRNLPVGCDSLLVAPFSVIGGQVDATTLTIPCGP